MTSAPASVPKTPRPAGWRLVLFAFVLLLFLWAALRTANALSDGGRIPSELAAARQQPGEMVCADGTIVRADGSLIERIFGIGTFRCGSWRMRARQVDPATGHTDWPSSPKR